VAIPRTIFAMGKHKSGFTQRKPEKSFSYPLRSGI
jgi:hypothetical protein